MRWKVAAALVGVCAIAFATNDRDDEHRLSKNDRSIKAHAQRMLEEGRRIFRYDTFGSEAFFGDALQLHKAIAGAPNGGVGPGVSPKTALAVGLKVDADALPEQLKAQIRAGRVDLDNPATTLALLRLTGFTTADKGTRQASLDALRAAGETSYYSDGEALWVKLFPATDGAGGFNPPPSVTASREGLGG